MFKGIILVIIASMLGMLGMTLDFNDTHYNLKAEVVSIENRLVTAEDANGELWKFTIDDNDDLRVYDEITLIMDTNETDNNIYDDEVVNYR